MLPAYKTKVIPASTAFNLVCICLVIICPPLLAQEQHVHADYVIPIKHKQLSGSAANDHLETETFRNRGNKIWDSKPNYIFKAFDQLLHLVLKQEASFISPKTFAAFYDFDTHSEEKNMPIEDYLDCFYTGYVKGDNQSAVAVSLCHGMTGYIKTSFGPLFIQPANNKTDIMTNDTISTSKILHKIWRHTKPIDTHAVAVANTDLANNPSSSVPKLKRNKRNGNNKALIIELLVAVDPSMSEFHGANMDSYVLNLIAIISNIFNDASLGNSIKILVTRYVELKQNRIYLSNEDALNDLCYRLRQKGHHFDAAVLLTRGNICNMNVQGNCGTLGYAFLRSMCKGNACSIILDNGLQTAFTVAHEMGHMLSIPHDDEGGCQHFHLRDGAIKLHVMSSNARNDAHPWSWSDCSRHYFTEFLQQQNLRCLENTPKRYMRTNETRRPGEIYSLNQQCQLIYGKLSQYYPTRNTDCQILYCHDREMGGYTTNSVQWADGTPCYGNRNWCQKGKCVLRQY